MIVAFASRLSLARRPAEMHAPRVDHPCEEFLDRRPCSAVSSNAARATTDAKRAALLKRICSQQIAARCICPGQLMPCRRFRNPLLCSTAARQSATTTRAAAALRRSHWSAPGCRKMRGGDARTHNDRESTMPLASNAADRTSSTVARRRRRLGPSKNPRSDGARLWNRPYTLWRADRPAICGRNAVVH